MSGSFPNLFPSIQHILKAFRRYGIFNYGLGQFWESIYPLGKHITYSFPPALYPLISAARKLQLDVDTWGKYQKQSLSNTEQWLDPCISKIRSKYQLIPKIMYTWKIMFLPYVHTLHICRNIKEKQLRQGIAGESRGFNWISRKMRSKIILYWLIPSQARYGNYIAYSYHTYIDTPNLQYRKARKRGGSQGAAQNVAQKRNWWEAFFPSIPFPIGQGRARAGIVGPPSVPGRLFPHSGAYFAKKDSAFREYFAFFSFPSKHIP